MLIRCGHYVLLTSVRSETARTSISRSPSGGGTTYEDVNLIQPYRKNSFSADGTSTVYQLDVKEFDNEAPRVWVNDTELTSGFSYDYMWQDHGGYDYLRFIYDKSYNAAAPGTLQAPTGANCAKHLYGNTADHVSALGISPARMAYALATHILRLSDVYLIYAEAKLGANRATSTDPAVIDAFYAVHHRAVPTSEYPTEVSWDDIWKERRLEFAMEGDRWYDFVRVSYYDPDFCVNQLRNQKRNAFWGLDDVYKAYQQSGSWKIDLSKQGYDGSVSAPNVTVLLRRDSEVNNIGYFALPMSAEDVLFNGNLGSNVEGVHMDVREAFSY